MTEENRTSWSEFGCKPEDYSKLDEICHVTHIRHAVAILDDGLIRARPVYDKSRLNETRIHVVWLSPNDWDGAEGSRYGNVEFRYNWRDLIEGMRYYWVGTMSYTKTTACRILLTKNDPTTWYRVCNGKSEPMDLTEYDPTTGGGPWWHDKINDTHHWNGNYCLEVLYEGDLLPADACDLGFVRHAKYLCTLEPGGACRDSDLRANNAAREFLAAAACTFDNGGTPPSMTKGINSAFKQLKASFEDYHFGGETTHNDPMAPVFARAMLSAISRRNDSEQKMIAERFKSQEDIVSALRAVIDRLQIAPREFIKVKRDEETLGEREWG